MTEKSPSARTFTYLLAQEMCQANNPPSYYTRILNPHIPTDKPNEQPSDQLNQTTHTEAEQYRYSSRLSSNRLVPWSQQCTLLSVWLVVGWLA